MVQEAVPYDYNGVVVMWKRVVYAETEDDFVKEWEAFVEEFSD